MVEWPTHQAIPRRPFVIIESPYGKDPLLFTAYARKALLDSLSRGEAPFASHLLYPQVLDDSLPDQRETGIRCNLDIMFHASRVAVYIDHGISEGMSTAIERALRLHIPVEPRSIK